MCLFYFVLFCPVVFVAMFLVLVFVFSTWLQGWGYRVVWVGGKLIKAIKRYVNASLICILLCQLKQSLKSTCLSCNNSVCISFSLLLQSNKNISEKIKRFNYQLKSISLVSPNAKVFLVPLLKVMVIFFHIQ